MDKKSREKSRATLLHVDLKDLKAPLATWCAHHGLTPSEAVRRVLRRVLEGGPKTKLSTYRAEVEDVVADDRRRLEIRLTPAEHLALSAIAAREGMSLPRWLTGLVRLHLVDEQQFGEVEVAALARSSQVLLALSRNINQIARKMQQQANRDELTLAQIEYLADLVKTHTAAVSAVLTANSRRWRR